MTPRWSDFEKPLPQVKAEHPDIDLCCYFGFHVWWWSGPPKMNETHVFSVNDPIQGRKDPPWGKAVFSDGTEVTMHIDSVSIDIDNDDLYCYSLGWLRNQGLNDSLMSIWDAWAEVTRQECKKL